MCHARKRRPSRKHRLPDWLRDAAIRPAAHLLAMSLAVWVLNGVGVVPVTGDCAGDRNRPQPAVAVATDHASKMPESEGSNDTRVSSPPRLTRGDVVGRDGIEPPTLRFSAARSTD
jgi:hypothetical protein